MDVIFSLLCSLLLLTFFSQQRLGQITLVELNDRSERDYNSHLVLVVLIVMLINELLPNTNRIFPVRCTPLLISHLIQELAF